MSGINLAGAQQMAQHIAAWSQFSPILVIQNPLSTLNPQQPSSRHLNALNRYARDVRRQELRVLESLDISPDALNDWLNRGKKFRSFFYRSHPQPDWMRRNRHASLVIDDMQQLSTSLKGMKLRLDQWRERHEAQPRTFHVYKPAGLKAYTDWLYHIVSTRNELADAVVKNTEDSDSVDINYFYDDFIRNARQFRTLEASVEFFLGVKLRRPKRSK